MTKLDFLLLVFVIIILLSFLVSVVGGDSSFPRMIAIYWKFLCVCIIRDSTNVVHSIVLMAVGTAVSPSLAD